MYGLVSSLRLHKCSRPCHTVIPSKYTSNPRHLMTPSRSVLQLRKVLYRPKMKQRAVTTGLWSINEKACHEDVCGGGCIASRILSLKWTRVINFTLRPLCFRSKNPCFLLNMKLGGDSKLSNLNVSESSVTIPDVPHFPTAQLSKHRSHPRSHPSPYWQIFRWLLLTPQAPSPTNRELYSSRPD